MARSKAIALGCLTAWPLLYLLLFLFFFDSLRLGAAVIAVHVITMLLMFTLMGIYLVDLAKNDRIGGDQKAPWAVAILLVGLFAMPVYWYQNIWSVRAGVTAEPGER